MSNRRYNIQTRMKFLKGGQAKLDVNKDGKITGDDFKKLRSKNKNKKKKIKVAKPPISKMVRNS